jgi:hypothetical protein
MRSQVEAIVCDVCDAFVVVQAGKDARGWTSELIHGHCGGGVCSSCNERKDRCPKCSTRANEE